MPATPTTPVRLPSMIVARIEWPKAYGRPTGSLQSGFNVAVIPLPYRLPGEPSHGGSASTSDALVPDFDEGETADTYFVDFQLVDLPLAPEFSIGGGFEIKVTLATHNWKFVLPGLTHYEVNPPLGFIVKLTPKHRIAPLRYEIIQELIFKAA